MSERPAYDKWYYCYLPIGIANGATSLLIVLFAYQLGANVGQIGLIAAASSLSSVPAYMIWGSLSDRIKRRKPFVILGFVGMAICLILMGISDNVPDYFIANLLFGFLSSASAPVATILVIETAKKDQWAKRIAAFSQIGGIGWVAGLALGAIWLQFEMLNMPLDNAMRALFILGAALALISSIGAWKWIKEPRKKIIAKPIALEEHLYVTIERLKYIPLRMLHFFEPRTYLAHSHKFNRPLLLYLGCIFLLFAGFTAFYAFFPIFLADEIGLRSSEIFVIYIAAQLTSVVFYTRVAKIVTEKGSKKTQILGAGARSILFPSFLILALFQLPIAATFLIIAVLHAIVGLCWALINVSGSMIVSNLSPENLRGNAFGAYNAVQGFGAIAGPIAGGMVAQFFGYSAGFFCASGFIICGIIILIRLRV
ncbi:MAG: MFS transporter [Thermoplasmata archaeon]|nr:MFS transporter [Thermoplasmata archaeon]